MRVSASWFQNVVRSCFSGDNCASKISWISQSLSGESKQYEAVPVSSIEDAISGSSGARSQLAKADFAATDGARVWIPESGSSLVEHAARVEHSAKLAGLTPSEGSDLSCELHVVIEREVFVLCHDGTIAARGAVSSDAARPLARRVSPAALTLSQLWCCLALSPRTFAPVSARSTMWRLTLFGSCCELRAAASWSESAQRLRSQYALRARSVVALVTTVADLTGTCLCL